MKTFERYGYKWNEGTQPGTIELYAFANGAPEGRFTHLARAIDRIWNDAYPGAFLWNDWSERLLEGFCDNKWVSVTGPASSSKTTSAAIYALCSWYASPNDTVVICTSSTLDGLRRRIWKEISKFYRMRPALGNPVQSRNCIQFEKGHDDAGIFGLATDKGEIDKAIGKIIGFHSPKMLVIVDEAPYTPEAIVEACVNLQSGAQSFQFIGIGNAADQLDPHGRMSEPKNGWDSVSVESEQWETKRGVCIHLDGLKSPNVLAGKTKYPGLLNQTDIDTTIDVYGLDSPQFWQMRRGYWTPEGVQKTVLTMPMIVRGRAQNKAVFDDSYTLGASLDPAFEGGDRCVLRFGKCGNENGKKVMELNDKIFIQTVQSLDDPLHFQIVRQVKQSCEERGIPPYLFALDSTGEGGGLASIFQREWSREILCVEFGGRPSKHPVSQTNPKHADQEYDRRVTELWFRMRLLVQGEQIRGLDDDTSTEFCRRFYEMKGPYISIETKAKMKERTRRSPDLADNAVIMAELFWQRGDLRLQNVTYEGSDYQTQWRKFQQKRSLETQYQLTDTNQRYYIRNKERILKRSRDHYYANRESILTKARMNYVRVIRAKPDTKRRQKNWRLKTRYGISLEDYEALIQERFGKCDICQKEVSKPNVDHDSVTGTIRGILCNQCNQAIGLFRHNPEILRKATTYLEHAVTY